MRRDAMRPLRLEPSVVLTLGRDPWERCAEMGGETPCELSLWVRRWISLWATIHVRGVPTWLDWMRTLPGAVGGASRNMRGDVMRILPTGPYVELFRDVKSC